MSENEPTHEEKIEMLGVAKSILEESIKQRERNLQELRKDKEEAYKNAESILRENLENEEELYENIKKISQEKSEEGEESWEKERKKAWEKVWIILQKKPEDKKEIWENFLQVSLDDAMALEKSEKLLKSKLLPDEEELAAINKVLYDDANNSDKDFFDFMWHTHMVGKANDSIVNLIYMATTLPIHNQSACKGMIVLFEYYFLEIQKHSQSMLKILERNQKLSETYFFAKEGILQSSKGMEDVYKESLAPTFALLNEIFEGKKSADDPSVRKEAKALYEKLKDAAILGGGAATIIQALITILEKLGVIN